MSIAVIRFAAGDVFVGDRFASGWGTRVGRHGFYEGQWEEGLPNGVGLIVKKGRPYYFGEFRHGVYNGLGRTISDTNCFLGYFCDGVKNGVGELIVKHGIIIQGHFGNSVLHGFAEIVDPIARKSLLGSFKSGELSGIALTTDNEGKALETFRDGKRNGDAIYYDFNGNIIKKCVYSDNTIKGCCKFIKDGSVYEGYMYGRKSHGIGRSKGNEEAYVGNFHNDTRHGFGRLDTQAFTYIGNFKEDRFDGVGLLKLKEKDSVYFGSFRAGVKHGLAFECGEGKEFIGNLSNGKPDGYAIIKLNMQDEKYGYFQRGKLVEFADESNCKGLAEHKYSLKSFVECATRRVSMINSEIDERIEPIDFAIEDIEAGLFKQKRQLNEAMDSYRDRYDTYTRAFDSSRASLRSKLSIGSKQSPGITIMKLEESQQVENYIKSYDKMIDEYGRYYKPAIGPAIDMNDNTDPQSWLNYERDLTSQTLHRATNSPPRYRAKMDDSVSMRFAGSAERKEFNLTANYESFKNTKFNGLYDIKLEDQGKIAVEEDHSVCGLDWDEPILYQQEFTISGYSSKKLNGYSLHDRYSASPYETAKQDVPSAIGSKSLDKYFSMIDTLKMDHTTESAGYKHEHTTHPVVSASSFDGHRNIGGDQDSMSQEDEGQADVEWNVQGAARTDQSLAPSFTDPAFPHPNNQDKLERSCEDAQGGIQKKTLLNFNESQNDDVINRFQNEGEKQYFESVPIEPAQINRAQDVDYFRMKEPLGKVESVRPVNEINLFKSIEKEPLNLNRHLVEPVRLDYCIAEGIEYNSVDNHTEGYSSNYYRTNGKVIEYAPKVKPESVSAVMTEPQTETPHEIDTQPAAKTKYQDTVKILLSTPIHKVDEPAEDGSLTSEKADKLKEEKKKLERLKIQLEIEMMKLQLDNTKIEREIYQAKMEDLENKHIHKYASAMVIGYTYKSDNPDTDLP